MTTLLVVPAAAINLSSGWAAFWGAVSGAIPGLSGMMTTVGVILLVFALGKYLWERRRNGGGGGQGGSTLMWTAIVGALLAAPPVIIPIFLTIVDWGLNSLVAIFNAV